MASLSNFDRVPEANVIRGGPTRTHRQTRFYMGIHILSTFPRPFFRGNFGSLQNNFANPHLKRSHGGEIDLCHVSSHYHPFAVFVFPRKVFSNISVHTEPHPVVFWVEPPPLTDHLSLFVAIPRHRGRETRPPEPSWPCFFCSQSPAN